jgi:hypothetical protein
MNCNEVIEDISLLCDGRRASRDAALHIGNCQNCRERMNSYAAMGSELRLLASLQDQPVFSADVVCVAQSTNRFSWWQKGLTTMKIPRMAFALMAITIVVLSTGLVVLRARAGAAVGPVLELKYKLPPMGRTTLCVMTTDGNPRSNHCGGTSRLSSGQLLFNARLIATNEGRMQLGIKTTFVPGAGGSPVSDFELAIKDVPEQLVSLESGEKKEIVVPGFGTIEMEGKYLDHVPALLYSPDEALDPKPNEFRVVSPVLVRDNEVIANAEGSSSIETGDPDATLMFYVPKEGRYLVSVRPFDGAEEGTVHLGQIKFSLEGHDYLLLTSMPITTAEHVWVKREPDFKPSERMVRRSEARDDDPMFLVRSLRKLEQPRIEH